MSEAKIEVSIGGLSFSGEGEQDWLAQQLQIILDAAPGLIKFDSLPPEVSGTAVAEKSSDAEGDFTQPLGSYIKEKGGETNQTVRFLITADWSRRRGHTPLKTAVITKVLRDAQQKKLSNPADALNKNVSKGYCEKFADGFFITPDGLKALGHS